MVNPSFEQELHTGLMPQAYLDIETTGLSWQDAEVTVIGMYLVRDGQGRMVQLVGEEVTRKNLLGQLAGLDKIYTYNGRRFDLPFIHGALGVDLSEVASHHDLMHDCWRCGLYGGFKAVERQLGISRETAGVSGLDAIMLWQRYRKHHDRDALDLLLRYNREDVMNLVALRERLAEKLARLVPSPLRKSDPCPG